MMSSEEAIRHDLRQAEAKNRLYEVQLEEMTKTNAWLANTLRKTQDALADEQRKYETLVRDRKKWKRVT